eukprot:SAG31_NODE_754_length_12324_cov_3.930061_2_plen_387_part_00
MVLCWLTWKTKSEGQILHAFQNILKLPFRGANSEEALEVLTPWIGLAFRMNFLLVIVLALSFAATSHKLDNWYFFMPVVWLLLLYFMVLTTGTNLLESRPATKAAFPTAVSPKNDSGSAKMNCFDASKGDKFRVAFGALLALYCLSFVGFWGVLVMVRSFDILTIDRGSGWGLISAVVALVHIILGVATTIAGIKFSLGDKYGQRIIQPHQPQGLMSHGSLANRNDNIAGVSTALTLRKSRNGTPPGSRPGTTPKQRASTTANIQDASSNVDTEALATFPPCPTDTPPKPHMPFTVRRDDLHSIPTATVPMTTSAAPSMESFGSDAVVVDSELESQHSSALSEDSTGAISSEDPHQRQRVAVPEAALSHFKFEPNTTESSKMERSS